MLFAIPIETKGEQAPQLSDVTDATGSHPFHEKTMLHKKLLYTYTFVKSRHLKCSVATGGRVCRV
jgi:hypothetical protein